MELNTKDIAVAFFGRHMSGDDYFSMEMNGFFANWRHFQYDEDYVIVFFGRLTRLPDFITTTEDTREFCDILRKLFEESGNDYDSQVFLLFVLTVLSLLSSSCVKNRSQLNNGELIHVLITELDKLEKDCELHMVVSNLVIDLSSDGDIGDDIKLLMKQDEIMTQLLVQENTISSTVILDVDQGLQFNDLILSDPSNGFVISTWLRFRQNAFNDFSNNESNDLMSLTNSDGKVFALFALHDGKLILTVGDQRECFECFTFELNVTYHISINYEKQSSNKSKFTLFINGMNIQSKIMNQMFLREGHESFGFFSLKKIGKPKFIIFNFNVFGPSKESNMLFEIINVSILNMENKNSNVVPLLYYLGPNYSGNFQDYNFLSLLSSKKLIKLIMLSQSEADEGNKKKKHVIEPSFEKSQITLVFSAINKAFNKNGVRYFRFQNEKGIVDLFYPTQDYLFPLRSNILNCIDSACGFIGFLEKVENSTNQTQLITSLKLLFFLLDNDIRAMSQFILSGGYDILAAFLRSKKLMLSIEVLDVLLEHIGYNSMEPMESIICDGLAYKTLILDFDIWYLPGQECSEVLKFVLFQLTVFGQGSKYHAFNIKQLAEMKVIRRIVTVLKQNLFELHVLPEVQNLLFIMIKCQPNIKVIKLLQRYITFSVKKTHDGDTKDAKTEIQRVSGEMVLEVLVSSICDKQESKFNHDALKALNWKWVMGCFKGSHKVKLLTLKLFINFLHVQTTRYITGFIGFGGFSLISKSLEDCWHDNKIKNLLLAGCFNTVSTSENSMFEFVSNKLNTIGLNPLVNKEFLMILHSFNERASHELLGDNRSVAMIVLDDYIESLIKAKYNIPTLKAEFCSNIQWFHGLLKIFIIVKKSGDEDLMDKFQRLIEEIIIEKVFSDGQCDFEFVENLQSRYPVEFNHIILPLIITHLDDFQSLLLKVLGLNAREECLLRIFNSYLNSGFEFKVECDEYLINLETIGLVISKSSKKIPVIKPKSQLKYLIDKFCFEFLRLYIMLSKSPIGSVNELKTCSQIFMSFSQTFILNLDERSLAVLFTCLVKNLAIIDKSYQSIVVNCMRVFLMESIDNSFIYNALDITESDNESLVTVFSEASHWDDVQVISAFQDNDTILKAFNDLFERETQKYIIELSDRTIDEYLSSMIIKDDTENTLSKEIEIFNQLVFNSELKKYNAYLQDRNDDFQYFIDHYKTMLSNVPMFNVPNMYTLDNSEGRYRKRNKFMKMASYKDFELLTTTASAMEGKMEISEDIDDGEIVLNTQDNNEFDFDEDKNRRILRNLIVNDKIDEIYNVAEIVSLDAIESVMILGTHHIYFVENYFVTKDNEILDIHETPIDQRDEFVNLLKDVTSGDKNYHNSANLKLHKSKRWPITKLVGVSKRKFLLRDVALEAFFIDGSSILLTLINQKLRNQVFDKLNSKISNKHEDVNLREALKLACNQKIRPTEDDRFKGLKLVDDLITNMSDVVFSDVTKRWCNGEISNFYYLMLINTIAGRTFNDLTQYPVFPFVLKDYESGVLNLEDPNVFRDLSKPMGAQSTERELQFKERYEASVEMGELKPFHYGTHYSSAMIVSSYLIRIMPFTDSYLKLQGGKFDHADRLFSDITRLWKSASSVSTDVRELIPEFYYLPDFLVNSNKLNFGETQDGNVIGDVKLPLWADGDPVKFVKIMRDALESDYVSEHLHEWIDLIFGYKQQGEESVAATNVFHSYSYPGNINLEDVKDDHERAVITSIIHNFGQTPLQIFHKPHPSKKVMVQSVSNVFKDSFQGVITEIDSLFPKVDEIIFDRFNDKWIVLPWEVKILLRTEFLNMKIIINGANTITINDKYQFENLSTHGRITSCCIVSNGKFVIGFDNGVIKLFELNNDIFKHITNSQKDSILYEKKAVTLFGAFDSLKKMFGGNKLILLSEFICFRSGECEPVVKMKYFKSEDVIVTLGESRHCLIVWKITSDGIINEIRRIKVDAIRDFDVCETDGWIYVVNGENKMSVWTLNGLLVGERQLQEESTCVSCLEMPLGEFKRGDLVGVGYYNGEVEILSTGAGYELLKRVESGLRRLHSLKVVSSGSGVKVACAGGEGKSVFIE